MPYADVRDKAVNSAHRYAVDRENWKQRVQLYQQNNPKRYAYWHQKHSAKQRGILFLLTFEEWIEWWGDDFDLRGREWDSFQMCRYDDEGAYRLDNIYKATRVENQAGPRKKEDNYG